MLVYIIELISSIYGVYCFLKHFIKYFYNKKIYFRFFINKSLFRGKEVRFRLSANFKYSDNDLFQQFKQILDNQSKFSYHKVNDSINHKIYSVNNEFFISLIQEPSMSEDSKYNDIFIKATNVSVTLGTGLDIIAIFGDIVTELCKKLHVSHTRYSFQMLYDKRKNPYIGKAIRTISNDNIIGFYCRVHCYDLLNKKKNYRNNTIIDIGKKNISLNNENYSDLRNIADQLLSI